MSVCDLEGMFVHSTASYQSGIYRTSHHSWHLLHSERVYYSWAGDLILNVNS